MRVGLTYDLRADYLAAGYGHEETAEFDRLETIEAIESALRSLGYETDRVGHVKSLVARLAAGDRWDLVFNIAEGMHGAARESQVPALLDAYEIPYTFSDPLVLAVTLDKGLTKRVVRDLGLPTPDFCVVGTEGDIAGVRLSLPMFVKPLAEGTGKGINGQSKVRSREELKRACRRILRDFRQLALVEEFLPGREFTVGVVGSGEEARALGTLEVILLAEAEAHAYSYQNKQRYEELVRYTRVEDSAAVEAERVALAAWRGLGCRDGGRVDLRADDEGTIHFLEVNPLAGLNPKDSDLPILCRHVGLAYRDLIGAIMDSARQRVRPARLVPKVAANRRLAVDPRAGNLATAGT